MYSVQVNGNTVPLRPLVHNHYDQTKRANIALMHFIWEVFQRTDLNTARQYFTETTKCDAHAALGTPGGNVTPIAITVNTITKNYPMTSEEDTDVERIWKIGAVNRHQQFMSFPGQVPNERIAIDIPDDTHAIAMVHTIRRKAPLTIGQDTIEIIEF